MKMKKMKLALLLAATLSVSVFSCKKSADLEAPGAATETVTGTSGRPVQLNGWQNAWEDAANAENPYDQMGLQHNQCLKFILDNQPFRNLSDAQSVYASAFKYGELTYGTDEMKLVAAAFKVDELKNFYANIAGGVPSLDEVMAMTKTSGDASDYLRSLVEKIYDPKIEDADFSSLKRDIIEWESRIGSLSVSEGEKRSLYGFGSTLRYSLLAWSNAKFPDSGDGHVVLGRIRLFGWIATAIFDAVGFVAGSVATPATGVIVGAAFSGGAAFVAHQNNW